jgi:hypothetical protein
MRWFFFMAVTSSCLSDLTLHVAVVGVCVCVRKELGLFGGGTTAAEAVAVEAKVLGLGARRGTTG